MRSGRRTAAVVLLAAGMILVILNLRATMVRSTIPLRLDDVVEGKEIRVEHEQGRDDVCLLVFRDSTVRQVDAAVYEQIKVGDRLQKAAWSRVLGIEDREVRLTWSHECRQMAIVMSAAVPILLALAAAACRPGTADETSIP